MELGKFSPPDTSGLLGRERLFSRLDHARRGELVWLTGPAGAGKTSLISSWVRSREIPTIWYQLDEGDNDLARFLHFLSMADDQAVHPPHLLPEHLNAPVPYARHFFAQMFQSWSTAKILVLDNYHLLTESVEVHRMVDAALDLLPNNCLILIASRSQAPPQLERRYAYEGTTHIGWDDLRFTEAESLELARLWGIPGKTASALHAACDGWAAIQVLLMRGGGEATYLEPTDFRSVFNYLNTEFFNKLPGDEREFLLTTSVLPIINKSLASELSQFDKAATLLNRLGQEHLLTCRHQVGARQEEDPTYQFHPILREFLLQHLYRDHSADEVRQLQINAASLLLKENELEGAADLLVEVQDWKALAQLVRDQAPGLMESGRMVLLKQWLDWLPKEVRNADPWLMYWQAETQRLFNPTAGRQILEQAYHQNKAEGNADGAYLAWSGVVESFLIPSSDVSQINYWVDEFKHLQRRYPKIHSRDIELKVLLSGLALLPSAPFSELFRKSLDQAKRLIGKPMPSRHIGMQTWPIALHAAWAGNHVESIQVLLRDVEFPEHETSANPLSYALFCLAHAILDCAQLKIDSAIDWADKGLNLSAKTGVHLADRMLLSGKTLAATISGNSSWAETALALSEPLVDSASELDNGMLQYQRAGVLAMKSDYANALEKLNGLSDRLLSTGGTAAATFAELLQAQVLALNRQPIAARASLTKSRYFASHLPSPMMAFQTEMVKAYSWLIEGNKGKGIAALRRTMTIGHSIDAMTMTPFWLPHLITPLCAQALEYGIEFDYVKELIKRRGLTPASPAIEAWPWPIRVFTLGRFAILINDTPLIFSGKSQKKPLNLLKALIAMGGRAISTDTLASTLWENNDASDAKHALDMAVSRLRKILDNENAIVVYDGKLSLNDKLVWVDAQAFERNASELETMAPDTAAEKKHAFAQKAIDRYNGIFLRGDEESAWLLGRRDHLHSRYVRLVISHGNALEREVKHDSAKTCYLKALELDPLAEEIYQRLMSCHLEQGEQAQALEAYRRCKQMLSIVLGVAPSQRTEALATRARAAAHYGHE